MADTGGAGRGGEAKGTRRDWRAGKGSGPRSPSQEVFLPLRPGSGKEERRHPPGPTPCPPILSAGLLGQPSPALWLSLPSQCWPVSLAIWNRFAQYHALSFDFALPVRSQRGWGGSLIRMTKGRGILEEFGES